MTNQLKIRLLVYVTQIVYPKYNSLCFLFYMFINYCDICKQKQIRKIHIVNSTTLNKILYKNNVCDINNTVVVDNSNIATTYGTFVIIYNENDQGIITKRKAHLIQADLKGAHVVLLTTNLSHNLKGIETCTLRKSYDNTLKFADEVDLSLINSPTVLSNFIVDELLKNYFKLPKLLYVDDIIEIDLEVYGKEMFYFSNKMSHIYDRIYLRCNRVVYKNQCVKNGYYCAMGQTTLKQSPNIQSFIPRTICKSEEYGEIASCPYGLENHFESIRKAIQPFITKKNLHFHPVFLLEGRKGSGKQLLVKCIASYFGMHLYSVNNFDLAANVYAQNETKLRNAFFAAKIAAPSILEIRNFENFGKNNEGQYDERLINHFTDELSNFFTKNEFPLVVFCLTNEKQIPVELKRMFLKIFEIRAPNDIERKLNLQWICKYFQIETSSTVLNNLANKTHGFLFEDLKALVERALSSFRKENTKSKTLLAEEDFNEALDFMQSNYNESLGAPKVPKVQWSDVGGLGDVKDEIIKTIKLPLKHPELLKTTGLKRSGILLFGPPGTGKTLIAKAVATECGLCFLSVKGPELLNMYVGQSEENVREVFERAREASPCIIFFDELDSLAPNRGASGDSGGVMDRVVSQLLAEMDCLNDTATVFIIGATNRPDLIDPALLRPGRFDKLLYVEPCLDKISKKSVLQALTKKFVFEDDTVLDKIVDICPENFSGADFYGVCSNAWMSAVRRLITDLENGSGKNDVTSSDVIVQFSDFQRAIKTVKPSITQEDLNYFNKLKSELS